VTADVKLRGFDDVERLLKQLEPKMRSKHLRRGVRQAISVVRDDIKRTAPIRSSPPLIQKRGEKPPKPGRLRRLVRVRARRGKRGYLKVSLIYPTSENPNDNKNAAHWRFVEFGTKHVRANPYIFRSVKRQFRRVLRKLTDSIRVGVREEIRRNVRGK